MDIIWKRIEDWLGTHAPELLALLQPGASAENIQHAEALLHTSFPEDIKASYQIHNGSGGLFPQSLFLVEGRGLLSLQEMVEFWHMFVSPDEELPRPDEPTDLDPEFWELVGIWRKDLSPAQKYPSCPEYGYERTLIPFMRSPDEGVLCFDTEHDFQTFGIIIDYFAQTGFCFTAPNWRDLLSRFADELEAGKYRVERWDNFPFLAFDNPTQLPLSAPSSTSHPSE